MSKNLQVTPYESFGEKVVNLQQLEEFFGVPRNKLNDIFNENFEEFDALLEYSVYGWEKLEDADLDAFKKKYPNLIPDWVTYYHVFGRDAVMEFARLLKVERNAELYDNLNTLFDRKVALIKPSYMTYKNDKMECNISYTYSNELGCVVYSTLDTMLVVDDDLFDTIPYEKVIAFDYYSPDDKSKIRESNFCSGFDLIGFVTRNKVFWEAENKDFVKWILEYLIPKSEFEYRHVFTPEWKKETETEEIA